MRRFAAPATLVFLLTAGCTAGCARNPVTGEQQLSLISESQEIAMGREAAQQTIQQLGLVDDPALQQYVSGLGLALARESERPQLPWEFHVVEDAAVNAFALPGGFIFVTRGLLTHVNNEAELVSVLGHEIGHVTAKHSVSMISRAQVAQLGLGIGSILSEDVARYGQVAAAGLGILFLKYGRDAEKQADELGFRYMVRDGYDPRAMADMFRTLERVGAQSGGGRLPEWLSTHPDPGNRVEATLARLDTLSVRPSTLKRNREQYLPHLSGLAYGVNPRNGYFEGSTFYHPDMAFQLEFPEGWATQNGASAVVGVSPQQDAALQLALAQGTPSQAAQQFFSQEGIAPGQTSNAPVNGMPAVSGYFRAQTQQGIVEGITTFVRHRDFTFQLLGYAPQGRFAAHDATLRDAIGSFSRVTDSRVLNVKPALIELVKVPRAMSLEEFNRAYPSSVPVEEIALINGFDPGATIPAGWTMKRVRGGLRATG